MVWAEHVCARGVEPPEDLYGDLLAGPSRAQAAELPGLPAHHLPGLAADADPGVRVAACARWDDLPALPGERLLVDADDTVRAAALLAHHIAVPIPREVLTLLPAPRRALEQCSLAPELEAELVRDADPAVRRALAANPTLGAQNVAVLAQDPCDDIRAVVVLRPDLTEEQRAAVLHDSDPGSRSYPLPWVERLHGDAEAMRRLAASSHPLIRRSVARARHLPPDVVERLAGDEDRVVQLFLAESCDDAPAAMLLEVWRWWEAASAIPAAPATTPTSRAPACCATPRPRTGGCGGWRWTIRSPRPPTSHPRPRSGSRGAAPGRRGPQVGSGRRGAAAERPGSSRPRGRRAQSAAPGPGPVRAPARP
ncbi:hypothetical protein ACFXGG_34270 [Streptomyces nigra]|uniref:hypothetical protein n=1 Tax=Streptomyces nigra TaxID=1827580 RepID=UPI00369F87B7